MNTDIVTITAVAVTTMIGVTATAVQAINQAKRKAATRYPHPDGDFIVLGPEIFASKDGAVICWKGENYVRQQEQS